MHSDISYIQIIFSFILYAIFFYFKNMLVSPTKLTYEPLMDSDP